MKGYTKLTIQIAMLSISLIALSFLTDTDVWLEYFNYTCDASVNNIHQESYTFSHVTPKYHWHYRAWIYLLTGITYFILSVVKIINSHKEEDFK